ncbi:MAG: DUF4258 domain-containing protein [Stappiaceae bacterium]
MKKNARKNIVPFRPRPSEIETTIRSLAMHSKNVRWKSQSYTTHAESRMEWRGITDKMMFEVLRTGTIRGDIIPGRYPGEWKVKMTKKMKGSREVGVVTVVINAKKLFIKTVEWEDL